MPVPTLDHIIAFGSAFLLTLIATVFWRREGFKAFPWFFGYTVYHILQTLIEEPIAIAQGYSWTYVRVFYPLQLVSLAFSFGVIYEVFSAVLEPYQAINRVTKAVFMVATICLGLVALLLVVFGNGPGINRLAYAVFVTLRSLRIVQLGLLLLLFALARSLGLSWRSYSFGIALGYGLYAAVDLVLAAVRTQFGEGIWHLHSLLTTTAFTGMLFVWLFYILQRQAVAQPVRVPI